MNPYDQPEYLTREKYEELERELEQLKTVKRREIAESLQHAKSFGDLAEILRPGRFKAAEVPAVTARRNPSLTFSSTAESIGKSLNSRGSF